MSVIRVNKTKDFCIMSNKHFREKKMSLKAKGLLSQMLSLPDDWDYSITGLASINKESVAVIRATLNELKQFGYVKVTKKMPDETESGRIEYDYEVYEIPQEDCERKTRHEKTPLVVGTAKEEIQENQGFEGDTELKQDIQKQGIEKQYIEKQHIENLR